MTQSRERVKEANGKVQVVNLLPTAVEAATRLVQHAFHYKIASAKTKLLDFTSSRNEQS